MNHGTPVNHGERLGPAKVFSPVDAPRTDVLRYEV